MSVDGAWVAVDQGGHATRAVAYDVDGRLLAAEFAPVRTERPATDRVEHDGEALLESVRIALAALAGHVDPVCWLGIGFAVQRSSIACWGRDDGRLLSPVISWQDRRQADWLRQFAAQAGRVHQLTGLPLSPHYGASKLRWCLDNLPAVAAAATAGRLCAGPLASLLLARLVDGAGCVADEANASRTQLVSPQERSWSRPLLEMFGLPAAILPRLVPTCGTFGTLRVGTADVPVLGCTGDQSAVPFGCGPLDAEAVYVNLGTGAFALRPVGQARPAPPLLTSVLASDRRQVQYALEGTVNGAGSALDWLGARESLDVQAQLDGLPPGAGAVPPPLFLNGVGGVGSPFWIASLEPAFVGDGDVPQRLLAVLESIAFLLQANLDEISRQAGRPSRIIASGGLSHSDFLMEKLASLSSLRVERLHAAEATARGTAFLAAGRPGHWALPPRESFEPRDDGALQARYARWLELMRARAA